MAKTLIGKEKMKRLNGSFIDIGFKQLSEYMTKARNGGWIVGAEVYEKLIQNYDCSDDKINAVLAEIGCDFVGDNCVALQDEVRIIPYKEDPDHILSSEKKNSFLWAYVRLFGKTKLIKTIGLNS